MEPLTNISVIRGLLQKYGFRFSKSLGQNFIINPSICPRIAQAGGAAPGVGVLEIGPGIGVLTRELAARAEQVVAVEIDRRLQPILEETLGEYANAKVIFEDVMQLDLASLIRREFRTGHLVVCANLPYYITSPILMRLLEQRLPIDAITVMVQKEAAARICAPPGTRQCGAISAAIWYYSTPGQLFPVSKGSFMPAPKVDSAVIQLKLHQTPPIHPDDLALFFRVVKAAFSQRRKSISNSLLQLGGPKPNLLEAIAEAGIDPAARAETLTLDQFADLSNAIGRIL